MKVSANEADRFARAPRAKIRAVLVYGPDAGLVRERAGILKRSVVEDPSDPFRVTELTGRQLSDDPARLADESAALALTGGRRNEAPCPVLPRWRRCGGAEPSRTS